VTSSVRTMRAMRASGPDPASLACETIPVPEPGPGELLVEVQATAVTAGELTWPESWPAIPCHDLSGVVAAAGPGVEGWATGDEVYGLVGFDRPGAAAEYVTAPAAQLAPKPSAIDHLAAAAVPLGALTAWQALHEHARLQPGQHVLVHGGAGGVGAYAVQLAALAGARVTTTARSWPVLRSGAPWLLSPTNQTRATEGGRTFAACTSWSGPTLLSCANWPA